MWTILFLKRERKSRKSKSFEDTKKLEHRRLPMPAVSWVILIAGVVVIVVALVIRKKKPEGKKTE